MRTLSVGLELAPDDYNLVGVDLGDEAKPGALKRQSYSVQQPGQLNRSPSIPLPVKNGEIPHLSTGGRSSGDGDGSSESASDSASDAGVVGARQSGLALSARDSMSNLANFAALELEDLMISAPRFQEKAGKADKQCPNPLAFGMIFQSRWLQLNADGALYYYLSKDAAEQGLNSRGVIQCSDVRKDKKTSLPRLKCSGCFLTIGVYSKNRRTYVFRFSTEREAHAWEVAVRSHL